MKTFHKKNLRQNERGLVTFVFIALLAIMVIFATAGSRMLFHLHREIQLVERQQIQRLDQSQTNQVAIAQPPANQK
jgi:hypothetical protein